MEKKETLLHSLAELKAAHEKASCALASIMTAAAKAAKGASELPCINDLRHYKQALSAAKIHASQAEMLLVDSGILAMPPDLLGKTVYMQ